MANEKGPKDVEKIKGWESTSIKDGLANTLKQPNPELFWNRDAILKDLKENHVKVEENVWYMWQYWKKVHINLPAVWKFRRFKFDYFVSNNQVTKREFEIDKLEEKSYSVKDVWRLLWAMNRYMQAMGVETDWDLDYENALKLWERGSQGGCNAWDCLMEITWLHRNRWLSTYWLNDRKLDRRRHHLRAKWCCYDGMCNFQLGGEYGDGDVAYLFFRCR
jgi:hypothetical protein